jgi:hypothetical protein
MHFPGDIILALLWELFLALFFLALAKKSSKVRSYNQDS